MQALSLLVVRIRLRNETAALAPSPICLSVHEHLARVSFSHTLLLSFARVFKRYKEFTGYWKVTDVHTNASWVERENRHKNNIQRVSFAHCLLQRFFIYLIVGSLDVTFCRLCAVHWESRCELCLRFEKMHWEHTGANCDSSTSTVVSYRRTNKTQASVEGRKHVRLCVS